MKTAQQYMNDYSWFMQTITSENDKPDILERKFYNYPNDPMCLYFTQLEKMNLDIEREEDIKNNRGFICSATRGIRKDVKDHDGIFSDRFGQGLGDQNPFIDRYKCDCGKLRSRVNNGIKCPHCGSRVRYVDDDFTYFGWLVMDGYSIIHPVIYMQIEFLFGNGSGCKSKLNNIINENLLKDGDGHLIKDFERPKNEPYYGIGMIEFKERFVEIMNYYLKLAPAKREYYNQIMEDIDKVFTSSIPVYTTHLRPFQINGGSMSYEDTNGIYTIMNRSVANINKNNTKFYRTASYKNQNLYNLQMDYMKLYGEIINILEGKKGVFRNLVSGRYNYTGRSVIIQDPSLEIDQVILPYYELVTVLEQKIINILHRSYNLSFSDAYDIWFKAQIKPDPRVKEIIQSLINSSCNGRRLPVLVNRNPTLGYGSILQMFCVGMTDSFVMKLPLRVLSMMNADFDGDALNILHIINDAFFVRAYEIYNPRCAMQISRDDGRFNHHVCPQRDTLLGVNTFSNMGRSVYTDEEMEYLEEVQRRWMVTK